MLRFCACDFPGAVVRPAGSADKNTHSYGALGNRKDLADEMTDGRSATMTPAVV